MLQKTVLFLSLITACGAVADPTEVPTLSPKQAKALYQNILKQTPPEVLTDYLSPETTELIEWYTQQTEESFNQDDQTVTAATPAAYGAAAAAGAVAGAVASLADVFLGEKRVALHSVANTDFDLPINRYTEKDVATPAVAVQAASAAFAYRAVKKAAQVVKGNLYTNMGSIESTDFDLK